MSKHAWSETRELITLFANVNIGKYVLSSSQIYDQIRHYVCDMSNTGLHSLLGSLRECLVDRFTY